MNNPDHISESLETIFVLKYFFDADLGWKKFGSGIRNKHSGSDTLVIDFPGVCSLIAKKSHLVGNHTVTVCS
jgi:hypothetical protein